MPSRSGITRAGARLEGRRLARSAATTLGVGVRAARKRRGWSQAVLGAKIGLSSWRIGQIERGGGIGVGLDVWFALGRALDLFFKVELGRDKLEEPLDAGHLAIQELALQIARQTGRTRSFELPTRPANPSYSIDVCLRDDIQRVLIIEECWNSFGDINGSVRSTRRKVAEAEALAVATGGTRPYRVAVCWIVRDTRRNREIVNRYPEVFASVFSGSSRRWAAALAKPGVDVPAQPGLVWCDLRASRLFARRFAVARERP